jgi:hypothetical protein
MEELGEKVRGKRPLGRHRRRREDNIKMDLREIEWGGVGWIRSTWLKIRTMASSYEHGNESSGSIKVGNFLSSWAISGFSRRTELHGVS